MVVTYSFFTSHSWERKTVVWNDFKAPLSLFVSEFTRNWIARYRIYLMEGIENESSDYAKGPQYRTPS